MLGFLASEYRPTHAENRMRDEGDLAAARKQFFESRPNNLTYLLKTRYQWMNEYLEEGQVIYELGCGAGFSQEFIKISSFKLTDCDEHEWADMKVDAMQLPFEDASVDAIITSHMIHHLYNPLLFFDQVQRVLKPGGYLLISEIHTSTFMRLLLWVMRHEGWSYRQNLFDRELVACDPDDPWAANCAIPQIMFLDEKQLQEFIPGMDMIRCERCECLLFPLSGGVTARTFRIPLPWAALQLIDGIDWVLAKSLPSVFALGMRVVFQKKPLAEGAGTSP